MVKKPEPEPVIEEKEAKTTEEKDATAVEGGENQEEVWEVTKFWRNTKFHN